MDPPTPAPSAIVCCGLKVFRELRPKILFQSNDIPTYIFYIVFSSHGFIFSPNGEEISCIEKLAQETIILDLC